MLEDGDGFLLWRARCYRLAFLEEAGKEQAPGGQHGEGHTGMVR
jgi:hypothetical protein